MIKVSIFVSVAVEGVHQWKECPHDDVSYLKDLHRHQFGIVAYTSVSHDNRDIEFIQLSHDIKEYLAHTYYDIDLKLLNFGNMSCEAIARELLLEFDLYKCEVNEDNENGAIVEIQK